MNLIKVPASDRARCLACGVDLFPSDGPRELFFRKSEETRAILLACQDCRRVLPEAWIPGVIERLDESSLKIEAVGPEKVLGLEIAQVSLSDAPLEPDDSALASSGLLGAREAPASAFIVELKRMQLWTLLGDAVDKARCRQKGGALILPGDLCLKVDGEALKEGDTFRSLRVVRDRDIVAKDTPFAYVVDAPSLLRDGRMAVMRFKQLEKGIQRPFARRLFVKESERRFILALLGEELSQPSGESG